MKYVAEFELKRSEMRSDYRRIFISFFKKAISEYMDGHFFEEIYNSGAKQKALVWSVKFDKPIFKDGMMNLESGKILLTLKIGDTQTALIYYSSILGMKNTEFPLQNGNAMFLKRIRLIRENEIVENFAIFKIYSPICIREHDKESNHDRYYSIGDEGFEKILRENLILNFPKIKDLVSELEFDVSKLKKVIVPAFHLKIPASIGVLGVKGDKRILNHILQNGVGSRRNSGFGLVENVLG
ncbi:MAG TPA: CRISPR-associated endoribonuclease Cas6 [Fusobacterium sp.]|uniref:CRISPR-associated endoribonuclease Cas6 n=1 Tax=Fusobacterium sp. TaxID=68766 RepID=UPI002F4199C7